MTQPKRGGQIGNKNAVKPADKKNTHRWHVDMPDGLYAEFAGRAGPRNMASTVRELITGWCDAPAGMNAASPETLQYYNGRYWQAICDIAEALGTGPDEIVAGDGLKLIYALQDKQPA